jgi:hypothetical protein
MLSDHNMRLVRYWPGVWVAALLKNGALVMVATGAESEELDEDDGKSSDPVVVGPFTFEAEGTFVGFRLWDRVRVVEALLHCLEGVMATPATPVA